MFLVHGTAEHLPEGFFSALSKYRYSVFVEQLGWDLNTSNGLELDQFDREDTVYVVARDEKGEISGCARLLPTTRPYLLGDIFPELLNGLPVPESAEVWELSRFAAVDLQNSRPGAAGQFSSPVAVGLLKEALACAAARGAKRLITVSPVGVERLLRRAGFNAHRAGPPKIVDGYPLFACWIEIESDVK